VGSDLPLETNNRERFKPSLFNFRNMEQNIKRYRAFIVDSDDKPNITITDSEMAVQKTISCASENYIPDLVLYLNSVGIKIDAYVESPFGDYILLTTDFNTPLL